jgi:hypothetical protein
VKQLDERFEITGAILRGGGRATGESALDTCREKVVQPGEVRDRL